MRGAFAPLRPPLLTLGESHGKGTKSKVPSHGQTLQLLDQISPVGRFCENKLKDCEMQQKADLRQNRLCSEPTQPNPTQPNPTQALKIYMSSARRTHEILHVWSVTVVTKDSSDRIDSTDRNCYQKTFVLPKKKIIIFLFTKKNSPKNLFTK